MKKNIFIFARGGSKGLPRKNIRNLAGKPLIVYSIEVAQQTPSIEHIFVSTDDPEIAEIAALSGAEVIPRPVELAVDTAPEWLAWKHAIDYVNRKHGIFDIFICLPPTSPLRNVQDVTAAIHLFTIQKADVCISVTPANRNPYFNMVKRNTDGFVELVTPPESTAFRRQDAPQVFDISTVVYVAAPNFIMQKNNLFEGKVVSVEIPKVRAVDIDDIYDFLLAEAIINKESSLCLAEKEY
jgi:N,N'-diacetyl-8-epilegionaminate cytidylyltransferase